jgi:phosphogluconate dehydratase
VAAIHLTPEAAAGGPLARVRDGDLVTLDADAGTLEVHVDDLDAREATVLEDRTTVGTGRELFAGFRALVGPADRGATVFDPRKDSHE